MKEFDFLVAYINEKLSQEPPVARMALASQLEPCTKAVATVIEAVEKAASDSPQKVKKTPRAA